MTMAEETLQDEIRAMIDCISRIYSRGWCDGTGGNYSHVLSHDPLTLLLTRSGVDKGRIRAEDFVVVDGEMRVLQASADVKPSSEGLVHAAIARHTGAKVILHTHSVWGTLLSEHFADQRGLSISGYEMLKGLAGIGSSRDQVFVPVLRNAPEGHILADGVARVLGRRPDMQGLLIAGHGLYTWGASLEQAQRHVEIFEFLLECTARQTGFQPLG